MAEAVACNADLAIATSDNPRTEDPSQILTDVEAGLRDLERVEADVLFSRDAEPAGRYAVLVDRRQAINLALAEATASDTVVLAGKGHEDYQIIGHEKFPVDDREEARRALLERETP
jgi:UDP-N-acetylmuramoyl-L-alanyl-D-glutamate--2,6-diaminopimelate ligase